jgi:hypothetical protein
MIPGLETGATTCRLTEAPGLTARARAACGEFEPDTKTRNPPWSLRYQGERGFALMAQQRRTRMWAMPSPGKIGDVAKAAPVLVLFEHKMLA